MVRILTFSSLFPSSARPAHGIFVETRLRKLVADGNVQSRVIAPVPWFFSTNQRFGEYAKMARTPIRETRNGLDVQHPRFFLPPAVGMNVAPFVMAAGALASVKRLINEGYDFDVIDAHYYYPDGVAAALLARHFKKPFTVTARGSDINFISPHLLPRKMMQWSARRASASIGVSLALTRAMARLNMPASKLLTMPNGVDLKKFNICSQSSARAELGWLDVPTLLSVGNLVENKGHHIAIQSLNRLPKFRLVIAGAGPERGALEHLVESTKLSSRVSFIGSVDQETLAKCYSGADILVLPSSREGWPNVLLESMACGTPVVATNVGGIPEIITSPSAGRLMAGRTATDLAEAVATLWNQMPERHQVRSCAEQFSWTSTTEAQINLFTRIAAQGVEALYA